MARIKIEIDGMSCQNCVGHVTDALRAVDGVTEVEVWLEEKNAVVESASELPQVSLQSAVEEAGYTVTGFSKV